jgi:cellobiose phosphorylase
MLTPVTHSLNRKQADRYKVEPYAVAADIYAEPPLTGMGGWTWYTGSAGWMYRVILESILGIETQNNNTLIINPSISPEWKSFSVNLNHRESGTRYSILVKNPGNNQTGPIKGTDNGEEVRTTEKGAKLTLKKDGARHKVVLTIQNSK